MTEKLCSVGLDVGTTSTQMVVSELRIENRAGSFAVPEMAIAGRTIRFGVDMGPIRPGDIRRGKVARVVTGSRIRLG